MSSGPGHRATTHLRPEELLRARDGHARGEIGDDELRATEDEAVREVVRTQEEVGLRSATDGEFRRASWHMDFIYQLGGVSKVRDELTVTFHNERGDIEFTPLRTADRRQDPVRAARLRRGVHLPAPDGHPNPPS
ncbi:uroporphyrinogen decarboxylase/cobalamine-independent methonine synthase family protein [Nocardiopsis quinghaiensis]|uniref:hypothetical protein n=1 Tax=Nocardiopsis quinghaiensis TaxID=464995 RepID=UPI001CC23E9C|nr:hypothetical protein [Nocardiopsis quinghaiensis]